MPMRSELARALCCQELSHARFGEKRTPVRNTPATRFCGAGERVWFLYLIPVHKSTDVLPGLLGDESQGFLSKEFALWNRYVIQKLLVTALQATRYHKHLVKKVQSCHQKFRHRRCENGHDWASPAQADNSCSVRLCPHCAHRKGKMQATRVQKFIVGRSVRYVVLAERNSTNLAAGIRSLYAAWNSLRRSARWKGKVKGSIAVLEVTYNKTSRTWHPHLNVLMEGDYFPFEELNQAWVKATEGKGQTSFIRAADAGTAFELVKYTLKIAELKDSPLGAVYELLIADPAALDEFLSAVYGVRLIRTYGTFRSMPMEDDEAKEDEVCPDCGSDCWIDLGPVYSKNQLSFDFEKQVFRVARAPSENARAMHLVRKSDPKMFSADPQAIAIAVEERRRARRYERLIAEKFRSAA